MSNKEKEFAKKTLKRLYNFKQRSLLKHMALIELVDLLLKKNKENEGIKNIRKLFERLDINNSYKLTS